MREYILIAVIVFVVLVTAYSIYQFVSERSVSGVIEEIPPISNALMVWMALVVAAVVLLSFVILYGRKLNFENNIGQIGDFFGGLINPVLSFLALLVLLRTTLIQTVEARKTTTFMSSQQSIMEVEKFENTFFQLLDRVEKYCEDHFRVNQTSKADSMTKIAALAKLLQSQRKRLDDLAWRDQLNETKAHIRTLITGDIRNGFYLRTARVVHLVHNANISHDLKSSYMNIARDTLMPNERILFSSMCFVRGGKTRKVVREWDFSFLKRHGYVSNIMADYYRGS
ncbi:hypothetical protein [Pseudomonas sp. LW8]|uniref:hypothetical protein n=1 Tax=Pseudomonas sp. LW8 TaxID=3242677 RepID=UPI0035C17CE1